LSIRPYPNSGSRYGDAVTARTIEITNPDKPLWPVPGITKRRYVEYLEAVSELMLPWLRDRPLSLVRAPDGVEGERYFQKNTPKYAPEWIKTVTIPAPSAKRDVAYTVCNDVETLRWLGNQAALEFHPAPVRRDRLFKPDQLVVDIDPPDGAFEMAVEVALLVLEVTDDLGMTTLLKTTGGKGLHVVIPIQRTVSPEQLRHAADQLTTLVMGRRPDLVTAEFRKDDRRGRVMLDPSRNSIGATVVAPYSPRVRDGATVSFPVVADELGTIDPATFTVSTVPGFLDRPGPVAWAAAEAAARQRVPGALLT
jgi:DNA ligase D